MLDLSKASRSQVQKLQFGYDDYSLFYNCLASILRVKKNLAGPVRDRMIRNVNDLDILLQTMREEGNIE